jgi:hypothetical protein
MTYTIDKATKAVTCIDASGSAIIESTTPPPPVENFTSGNTTSGENTLTRTTEHGRLEAYIEHPNNIMEYIPSDKKKNQRFFINSDKNIVIEMKGSQIAQVFDTTGGVKEELSSRLKARLRRSGLPKSATINEALAPFKEVLGNQVHDDFIGLFRKEPNKLKAFQQTVQRNRALKTQYVTGTIFNALGKEKQALLVGLTNQSFKALKETVTAPPPNPDGFYSTFDALNAICKFVPESIVTTTEKAKEGAENAAKGTDWGKFVIPALSGALIGGAALFGLDYFLQRRKPKAVAETEPT